MRVRVLGVVLAINAAAAVVAGAVVVHNARVAAAREMTASVEMAERMVRESAERMAEVPGGAASTAGEVAGWPVHLRHLRHVRIVIEDAQGRPIPLDPPQSAEQKDAEGGAPAWFARLVGVSEVARDIEVHANGMPFARVRVAGVPDDEVDEVWEDVTDFAVVAIAVNAAILLALSLALGRVRSDLGQFRSALGELEQNRFSCRVDLPRTRELAEVAERFNALAAALDAAREDNACLNARLVSLQEDERRQLSRELHDELGPLMFGLKASAQSLQNLAAAAPPEVAGRIAARTSALVGIVERMQLANRRLLRKIRPAALEHVALCDVLSNLLADFGQHDGARRFLFEPGTLADHYGPALDATLYRCVQEAVTNALRHGDAHTVHVALTLTDGVKPRLRLVVTDDGCGPPATVAEGLGLTGMRERVRALGGTCRLLASPTGGACLVVEIPVAGDRPPANLERSRT
ncbi:ATP-binding protein [Xanthobacter oligotrophicus]|uniref:ATP-binding protein n=1 Tax=Xanthobacter oligotrophicus TaxID=2607286 RepID=A0ABW6ZW48_9HYPH